MATTERTTAVGVFTDHTLADRAIEELRSAGFTDDQLGFVKRHEGAGALSDEHDRSSLAGAASGAVGGGIIGGVVGAAVSLLIPGIGPAFAAGILAATFGGAAIGAVAGGFAGSLISYGVPEDEANYYQQELAAGRTVVTVLTSDRYEEAVAILRRAGAYDASVRDTMPAIDAGAATEYPTDAYPTAVPPLLFPGTPGSGSGMGNVNGALMPPVGLWPPAVSGDEAYPEQAAAAEETHETYGHKAHAVVTPDERGQAPHPPATPDHSGETYHAVVTPDERERAAYSSSSPRQVFETPREPVSPDVAPSPNSSVPADAYPEAPYPATAPAAPEQSRREREERPDYNPTIPGGSL